MNFFRRNPPNESSDEDSLSHSEEDTDDEVEAEEDPTKTPDAQVVESPADESPAAAAAAVATDFQGTTSTIPQDDHSSDEEYETESDDESEPKKKGGWFGFLRRKQSESSYEEETESEDEPSDDEAREEVQQVEPAVESLLPVSIIQQPVVEAEEEEIAQAIQRVQQRIADYRKKQAGESSANEATQRDSIEQDAEVSAGDAQDMSLETEVEPVQESTDEIMESEEPSKETEVQPEMTAAEHETEAMTEAQEEEQTIEEQIGNQEEEEEDDEVPSLSERRSLLSLAAEHNRVDVIKELISMTSSEEDRTSLLQGVGGHTECSEFVPPPLHAAVAHGSVDAASCLLRMGADPSLRPLLPGKLAQSNISSSVDQDRNYKKYHGRSAWELAFGALVKIEEGHDVDDEVETKSSGKGWFGFGSKEDDKIDVSKDGVRYKQISGLNIPEAKLDGIHHAFTAEALRAIGSDEVYRLSHLLDAGMNVDIEVAGKTLKKWAGEMDAAGCLALLMRVKHGEDDSEEEKELIVEREICETSKDNDEAASMEVDQNLAGLSNSDIITLIQESESLIPALTACLDDLAEEFDVCQNILQDIKATGGQGGLSSLSLLELVRTLKEDRHELEETCKQWQDAWEEREDELDWFLEEAIDDVLRQEFSRSGILDTVEEEPARAGMRPIHRDATLQELTHRYHSATNRVETLRTSIASLAEASASYRSKIESSGLSGALSLVQSLRGEVKELKEKISQAQAGESICRRKIELIQGRIGHPVKDGEPLDDYQLNAIAFSHEDEVGNISPAKVHEPTQSEMISGQIPIPEIFSSKVSSSNKNQEFEVEEKKDHGEALVEQNEICDEEASYSHSGESEYDESSYEGDYEHVQSVVDEIMYSETQMEDEERSQPDDNNSASKSEPNEKLESHHSIDADMEMKQSELRESGMSTAIVVR